MIDWLLDNWLSVWLIGGGIVYIPALIIVASVSDDNTFTDGEDVIAGMFWTACACVFWPLAVVLLGASAVVSPVFGLGYWILTTKHRRSQRRMSVRASNPSPHIARGTSCKPEEDMNSQEIIDTLVAVQCAHEVAEVKIETERYDYSVASIYHDSVANKIIIEGCSRVSS